MESSVLHKEIDVFMRKVTFYARKFIFSARDARVSPRPLVPESWPGLIARKWRLSAREAPPTPRPLGQGHLVGKKIMEHLNPTLV